MLCLPANPPAPAAQLKPQGAPAPCLRSRETPPASLRPRPNPWASCWGLAQERISDRRAWAQRASWEPAAPRGCSAGKGSRNRQPWSGNSFQAPRCRRPGLGCARKQCRGLLRPGTPAEGGLEPEPTPMPGASVLLEGDRLAALAQFAPGPGLGVRPAQPSGQNLAPMPSGRSTLHCDPDPDLGWGRRRIKEEWGLLGRGGDPGTWCIQDEGQDEGPEYPGRPGVPHPRPPLLAPVERQDPVSSSCWGLIPPPLMLSPSLHRHLEMHPLPRRAPCGLSPHLFAPVCLNKTT